MWWVSSILYSQSLSVSLSFSLSLSFCLSLSLSLSFSLFLSLSVSVSVSVSLSIYLYIYICLYIYIYGQGRICDPHFCPKSHFPQFYSTMTQKRGSNSLPFFRGVIFFAYFRGNTAFSKKTYKNRVFDRFWGFEYTNQYNWVPLKELLVRCTI